MSQLRIITEASADLLAGLPRSFYDYVPKDVWVEPALSGPQIKVSWNMPACYIDPLTQQYFTNDSAGYARKISGAGDASRLYDIVVLPLATSLQLAELSDSYVYGLHCLSHHTHFEIPWDFHALIPKIAQVPYNVDPTSAEYGRMYDLVLPPVEPDMPLSVQYTIYVLALIASPVSGEDYVYLLDTSTIRTIRLGRHFENYGVSGGVPRFEEDEYNVQAEELRTEKPCGLLTAAGTPVTYGYVKPPREAYLTTDTLIYPSTNLHEEQRVRGAWEYGNVRLSRPHIERRTDLDPIALLLFDGFEYDSLPEMLAAGWHLSYAHVPLAPAVGTPAYEGTRVLYHGPTTGSGGFPSAYLYKEIVSAGTSSSQIIVKVASQWSSLFTYPMPFQVAPIVDYYDADDNLIGSSGLPVVSWATLALDWLYSTKTASMAGVDYAKLRIGLGFSVGFLVNPGDWCALDALSVLRTGAINTRLCAENEELVPGTVRLLYTTVLGDALSGEYVFVDQPLSTESGLLVLQPTLGATGTVDYRTGMVSLTFPYSLPVVCTAYYRTYRKT